MLANTKTKSGIARLIKCKFDTYKSGRMEGEWYWSGQAVALEPSESPSGDPVAGLYTYLRVPLCDTERRDGTTVSVDEHIGTLLNEFRKLGLDTSEYSDEELEQMSEDLQDSQPIFRFSTSQAEATKEFPNPRVWENWHGVRGIPKDYSLPDEDEVEDETDEIEEEEQQEEQPEVQAGKKSKGTKKGGKGGSKKQDDEVDVVALAEAADAGDQDAQVKLEAICDDKGIDAEDDQYDSWEDVAKAILGGEAHEDKEEYEDAEDVAEEEEDFEPEKGLVYFYKPPRARSAREMEVTAVFSGKQTANLKDLETQKVFKGVAWGQLSEEA